MTNALYFEAWKIEAKFDDLTWTNITPDQVGEVEVEYGIFGNGPLDRVAYPGSMTFRLKNSTQNSARKVGYYSPGHMNCRAGFSPGLPVRITFTLDELKVQKWEGNGRYCRRDSKRTSGACGRE